MVESKPTHSLTNLGVVRLNSPAMESWLSLSRYADSRVKISKVELGDDITSSHAARVKKLDLGWRNVNSFEGVDKLSEVQKLYANRCNFDSFPTWITRLSALVEVDLSDNHQLQTIAAVGRNWIVVNLNNCDIQSLPVDFFHYQLKEVHLCQNTSRLLLSIMETIYKGW